MAKSIVHITASGLTGSGKSKLLAEICPLPAPQAVVGVGERVRLSGELAEGVNFRLLVSGDLAPKDVKKLIKLIEIQLEDVDDAQKGKSN